MATITVHAQILDGNLGDNWTDNYQTARALGEYMKNVWYEDLDYGGFADDHEIEFDIEVERNANGINQQVTVSVKGKSNVETAYEMQERVLEWLTDENEIWEQFCSSTEAEQFIKEE